MHRRFRDRKFRLIKIPLRGSWECIDMRFNNGDELINEIRDKWNKNLRSTRIWGFVASIFMIVIGIVCCFFPVQSTYFIEVLASVALLAFGIWEVVRYVQSSPFLRTGVSLASGILNIILAIMLLTSPAEEMLLFFGFLFGLDLMMLGFEQVTASGRLGMIGVAGTGWLTADGILNIIFGIILLFVPMASIAAVSVILAMYLIFGGISLLITCINAKDLKAE